LGGVLFYKEALDGAGQYRKLEIFLEKILIISIFYIPKLSLE